MDKEDRVSHDQSFKNLTVDYPIQSIEFFAHTHFPKIAGSPRVCFLRQEQQKKTLSKHYRELDVPLMLEWQDGKRVAMIFAIEEEISPYKFNIIRLAHYALDLAEQHQLRQVIPVVVFLNKGKFQRFLHLGTESFDVMQFQFVPCSLANMDYRLWMDSDNLVARLNLPNMQFPTKDKLFMYHKAVQGLLALEPNEAKRRKYFEFLDQYAKLNKQKYRIFEQ